MGEDDNVKTPGRCGAIGAGIDEDMVAVIECLFHRLHRDFEGVWKEGDKQIVAEE
jgi:hypothetical protein